MRRLSVACVYHILALPSVAISFEQCSGQATRQLNEAWSIPLLRAAEHRGDSGLQHLVHSTELSATQKRQIVLDELRDATNVLQNEWFELTQGRWPTSIDWTGAVLNTHLTATLNTLSRSYLQDSQTEVSDLTWVNTIDKFYAQACAYYYGEHAASLRQQAYDDMLWVVLSWLESTKMSKAHSLRMYSNDNVWHGTQYVPVFAKRARSFYNITTQGWDTKLCGGGMTWNPRLEPYKNAITNQLYIAASIGMYHYFPHDHDSLIVFNTTISKQRFLQAALDSHEWLRASNMTNIQGLYVDGFHIGGWNKTGTGGTSCNQRNEMVYTYNQGVLLSGLRGLWDATGEQRYLLEGHAIIRSTVAATGWLIQAGRPINNTAWQGLGRAGIMEDYCDSTGRCDQNGHVFKSVYFHHLALFCEPSASSSDADKVMLWHRRQCRQYIDWVAHNVHASLRTKDRRGRIGNWWAADLSASWRSLSAPTLPAGAVDYRNAPLQHIASYGPPFRPVGVGASSAASSAQLADLQDRDPNLRGRGRTVESHAGGIAVLRCLLELLDIV